MFSGLFSIKLRRAMTRRKISEIRRQYYTFVSAQKYINHNKQNQHNLLSVFPSVLSKFQIKL